MTTELKAARDQAVTDAAILKAQELYISKGVEDIHRATCLRWAFVDGAIYQFELMSAKIAEMEARIKYLESELDASAREFIDARNEKNELEAKIAEMEKELKEAALSNIRMLDVQGKLFDKNKLFESELTTLRKQVEGMKSVLNEAADYLDISLAQKAVGAVNSISTGSILHEKIRAAALEQHAKGEK